MTSQRSGQMDSFSSQTRTMRADQTFAPATLSSSPPDHHPVPRAVRKPSEPPPLCRQEAQRVPPSHLIMAFMSASWSPFMCEHTGAENAATGSTGSEVYSSVESCGTSATGATQSDQRQSHTPAEVERGGGCVER